MKVKEKKEKMTPEQEKKTTTAFDDFNKYLDSLIRGGG
jgi:hypothetical protein